MPNYNRTFVIGRTVADAQTRPMPNGGSVVSFDIAENETRTDAAGVRHDEVLFIPCEAFDRLAERLSGVRRGETLFLSGKLRMERWTSQHGNGEVHTTLKLVVDQFQFLTPKDPAPRVLHEVARALGVDGPTRDRDDEQAPF